MTRTSITRRGACRRAAPWAAGAAMGLIAFLGFHGNATAQFPSLQQAIDLARGRAIIVTDAEGDLGVANAQLVGARVSAIGNPWTDIQIDRGLADSTTVQALSYTYIPLEIAGQRGRRVAEAERHIDWRVLGLAEALSTATGDVVAAYGTMLIESSRVSVASAGEQAAREEVRYCSGRLEAKDTTIYELSLAEAEVARWVQTGAEARLRLAQARARFAELVGIVDVDQPPADANLSPPPVRATWDDAYIARAVERAPLLARVEGEKRYWDASRARYQRERVPPLELEIIAGRGALGEVRLGGGAVVTFPLTRRYQGEIARAEQGVSHAEARRSRYRTIVEARLRAARDAILAVRTATEEIDRSGVPALERAVTAATEAFKAGQIDLSRELLVRRDLSIARARRLDLLEAGWRAYADLIMLSGQLQ